MNHLDKPKVSHITKKVKTKIASSQINHPTHYNQGNIEAIAVIEDWKLDFHLGNAVKYICRAGKKNSADTTQDLEKALWYIKRKIKHPEFI